MKIRRRILSSILATSMVVLLFQAVALGATETISGTNGSFTIDTENEQPNPDQPGTKVPVEKENIYTVDENAGTVTVRPGAKITLSGNASDYRIIVLGRASGNAELVPGAENDTVEITLKGFTSDRAPQKTSGGSGTGGTTTGDEGQDAGGTSGENPSGSGNPDGTGTGDGGQGSDTGESGNTPGTGANARAKEDGGSVIALQDGANVILYLDGTNEVNGGAGAAAIEVPEGNSLTIAQKAGSGSGKLTAAASGLDSDTIGSGAAIGGNAGQNSGSITINSGTIEASVESDAQGSGAAIGGGANGIAGAITINDGTVTATSRGGGGAAIGGGAGKSASEITINDGTVTANTSGTGAAIGGGSGGNGGTIKINNGTVAANATGNGAAIGGGSQGGGGQITIANGEVRATAVGAGASIGGGNAGAGATVTITGGEVEANANIGGGEGATLQGSLTVRGTGTSVSLVKGTLSELVGGNITVEDGAEVLVEMDKNVTVPRGQTLTIPAGVTLTILSGKTLTIEGKLEINGTINGKGDLYCFKAEEGGVIGADKIDKSGGLDYTPPCPHRWPVKWEKYTPTEHKQVCLDCGAIRAKAHRWDEAEVICIECNEWKDPKYIYLEDEKTLTVYKSFGAEEIGTEYWKDTVSNAEEIVIMDSVQYIPQKAFEVFEGVKHIYIPESVEETVDGQTFSSKADKVTVYCPDKWINSINPTEDTAAKFVFYKMDGETAVITKITDKDVDLKEGVINGKPIYFEDSVLKDFPDVKHAHRLKVDEVDSSDMIDSSDNRSHSYTCAVCEVKIKERHRGGVATCVDKAVCEVCGDEYGRVDRSYHPNLEVVARQEATHLEDGNVLYWYCPNCDRYFSDAAATERIKERSTILKAVKEHAPQQTEWLKDAVEHWHTCECGELIDVKPHSFEWVIDKAATEMETGLRHQRCSVCGYEKAAEEIPRLNQSNNSNGGNTNNDQNNGNTNNPNGGNTNSNQNNGNQNTGNQNTGNQNTGNQNTGNQNTGNQNTLNPNNQNSGNQNNTDTNKGSSSVVKTGDYANLIPWIVLLIASGAGIVGVAVYKKAKSKKNEK